MLASMKRALHAEASQNMAAMWITLWAIYLCDEPNRGENHCKFDDVENISYCIFQEYMREFFQASMMSE